jgi:hypothetical protein
LAVFLLSAASNPRIHVQVDEDEAFYILDGEIEFGVDGQVALATPGTFAFVACGDCRRSPGGSPPMAPSTATPPVRRSTIDDETVPLHLTFGVKARPSATELRSITSERRRQVRRAGQTPRRRYPKMKSTRAMMARMMRMVQSMTGDTTIR